MVGALATADPVWVTGMAWCTAMGDSLDGVWQSLLAGESGLREVPSPHPLRTNLAAVAPSVPWHLSPAERQRLMAADTVGRALDDAGLRGAEPRVQLVVGTSYGPHLDDPSTSSLSRWSAEVADSVGLVRRPLTVTTACSAGSDALLVALELIRGEVVEMCVCGGVDVLTAAKRLGHSLLGTMSPTALRAFDHRHDGTLLGEGAGFLVLESARSARARGARSHGVLSGAGSSNDATGSAAPDPSGHALTLAVDRALASAGRDRASISLINAHGSGTRANDVLEARGYSTLFGGSERWPVVFATKGALGHSLGATGVLEAITVLRALATGTAPPVHGLDRCVDELELPIPIGGPMPVPGRVGMSVTLGFGGFNTCLVLEAASDDGG